MKGIITIFLILAFPFIVIFTLLEVRDYNRELHKYCNAAIEDPYIQIHTKGTLGKKEITTILVKVFDLKSWDYTKVLTSEGWKPYTFPDPLPKGTYTGDECFLKKKYFEYLKNEG